MFAPFGNAICQPQAVDAAAAASHAWGGEPAHPGQEGGLDEDRYLSLQNLLGWASIVIALIGFDNSPSPAEAAPKPKAGNPLAASWKTADPWPDGAWTTFAKAQVPALSAAQRSAGRTYAWIRRSPGGNEPTKPDYGLQSIPDYGPLLIKSTVWR